MLAHNVIATSLTIISSSHSAKTKKKMASLPFFSGEGGGIRGHGMEWRNRTVEKYSLHL